MQQSKPSSWDQFKKMKLGVNLLDCLLYILNLYEKMIQKQVIFF